MPEPEVARAPVPSIDVPWRWFHRAPRFGSSLFDGALNDRAAIDEVGRPHRFVVERMGSAVVLRREDGDLDDPSPTVAWSRRHAVGATGAPVVGRLIGDALFVAVPTEAGYALLAADPESGEARWSVRHEADGTGAVQLGVSGDRGLLAYVAVEEGAYVHALRAEDGGLVGRVRYGSEVRRAFSPPDRPTAVVMGRASGSGYRLVRTGRDRRAVVGPGWRQELPEPDPFSTHASFVEVDDVVVVVTYCDASSGSSVHGLDRATGAVRWQTYGGSIGLIGHSRYRNDVRARLEGDLLRVYGDESSGRYVGTVDVSAGRLLGYEVWRR